VANTNHSDVFVETVVWLSCSSSSTPKETSPAAGDVKFQLDMNRYFLARTLNKYFASCKEGRPEEASTPL